MEEKQYTSPLVDVVELNAQDIVTVSFTGTGDSGDNIYDYEDIFG